MAVDSVGNLYIADSRNERIRALTPSTGRTRLDFAHFASGAGITSDLVLVNVAAHLLRPAIYFYDQGGNLIAAELVVGVTGDLLSGSVKVTSDRPYLVSFGGSRLTCGAPTLSDPRSRSPVDLSTGVAATTTCSLLFVLLLACLPV